MRKWLVRTRDWLLRIAILVIAVEGFGFGLVTTTNTLITFLHFIFGGSVIVFLDWLFEKYIKKIIKYQLLEIQVLVLFFMILGFAWVVSNLH